MSKTSAGKPLVPPRSVLELVQRFAHHQEAYKQQCYNETQVRREFIDPLFKALGWDVDNQAGHAEAYKDVIHEDAIKVGGSTKAPDYCFRIGGVRKFFVEAKKPAVTVKDDPSPAYQLRRYAWTAKLPLAIVTDFEEFAVYDCRIRPKPADKPTTARVKYVTYDQYADRWEEIAAIFSKEAILQGSFDKYAESNRRKRGTAEVDTEFLKEIERWRDLLARNIALRNRGLSVRELNYAVSKTIDRLIFLRMCEDRGVETYAQLRILLNAPKVYDRLLTIFRSADDRYNSGLFYFQQEKDRADSPDELTPGLIIDDGVLKDIIKGLYYPECPYEFSVLPPEILGQVYEQFLGKVIRLTAGGRAKIEDKPEVKKAGGVYYTPTYIVDYIVKHTVGKLLEGRTVKWIARDKRRKANRPRLDKPLRILDPACGSGSFLLGAYAYLLRWHLDYYTTHDPEEWAKKPSPPIHESASPQSTTVNRQSSINNRQLSYRLSIAERKRILLDHIHGVDIDPQAVEVTKLSLLLKVLEGESQQTLDHQLRLLHERALPDLAANIKCGNSLIGPDFYENRQMPLLDDEERYRINVFDWQTEFAEIMGGGGFDAVIGNPPYIRMEAFKELKRYLREHYMVHDQRTDLYVYFIEREHELLRENGRFGMIVSNKFLRANYGRRVREFLAGTATIERIVDLAGLPVFRGVTVRTIVLITRKGRVNTPVHYSPPPEKETFIAVDGGSKQLQHATEPRAYDVPQDAIGSEGWRLNRPEHAAILDRLSAAGAPLHSIVNVRVCRGIVSGLTDAFVISAEQKHGILRRNPEAEDIIRPFLQGRNIRRYSLQPSGEYLIYTYHGIDMSPYGGVVEYLRPFKRRLEARATKQAWYELQQPQYAYKRLLELPKLVFPDIATECRFALDTAGHYGANTVYFLPTNDLFLLGLLNSRVALFYFVETCAALEGPGQAYLRFFGQYLEGFPVPTNDDGEKNRRDRVVALVQQMLDLHKQLGAAKTPTDKTAIQRQIDATDKRIDQLVYELYGLTAKEIAIVEEATRDQRS